MGLFAAAPSTTELLVSSERLLEAVILLLLGQAIVAVHSGMLLQILVLLLFGHLLGLRDSNLLDGVGARVPLDGVVSESVAHLERLVPGGRDARVPSLLLLNCSFLLKQLLKVRNDLVHKLKNDLDFSLRLLHLHRIQPLSQLQHPLNSLS